MGEKLPLLLLLVILNLPLALLWLALLIYFLLMQDLVLLQELISHPCGMRGGVAAVMPLIWWAMGGS
jgi:hypothetical protein